MNKLSLHPTALSSAAAKLSISADAKLDHGSLLLSYRVEVPSGAPGVVWPLSPNTQLNSQLSLGKEKRRDELWKATCLEAFVLFDDGKYIELNFAPAGFWNAYSFNSYRDGMEPDGRIIEAQGFSSSVISDGSSKIHELSVKVDLSQPVKSPQHFRLGLTSVIETTDGERSYWSLKHPGEKPDFHDSRGHVLEMRI